MNWLVMQIGITGVAISFSFIFALLVILGLVGLWLLWSRGRRAEGISFLNTMLLVIVIILLLVPH